MEGVYENEFEPKKTGISPVEHTGMKKRIIRFSTDPYILCASTVVGKKEHEGPLGEYFDIHDESDMFGQSGFEKAESEMQRQAMNIALSKRKMSAKDVDAVFAGDLLAQCVGSSYGLVDLEIPFFGLYGACSTAAEALMLAALTVDRDVFSIAAAVASSHNSAAERQFRFPLEYGSQRPPTAQWTVTGAGAFLVGRRGSAGEENTAGCPRITAALPGKMVDMGITDANNMGAAMAPAAADTLLAYFRESGEDPKSYDHILTGDLGYEGNAICRELLKEEGIDPGTCFGDCGMMIYDQRTQDTHSGGSGCGCSATVLGGYIMDRFRKGEIKKILLVGTGALMNPSMLQQGKSIVGIGHLIKVEA